MTTRCLPNFSLNHHQVQHTLYWPLLLHLATPVPLVVFEMPSQKREGADVLTVRGTDTLQSYDHDHRGVNKNAQHGDALRLMLGSILAPKRPPMSHSSSGTASPAHSFSQSNNANSAPQHPASAPATPHHLFGYPHVHPYPTYPHTPSHSHSHSHPHSHFAPGHQHSHGHSLPRTPSKLGVGAEHDTNSCPSATSSHSSQHPSPIYEAPSTPGFFGPRPGRMSRSASTASSVPRLPPSSPVTSSEHHVPVESPVPVSASAPEIVVTSNQSSPTSAKLDLAPLSNGNSQPGSGTGTPKNKFIQTLEGKSAWDALIHGSFS